MLEFFFLLFWISDPLSAYFPGYAPLPNPTAEELIVIPIPRAERKIDTDPVETA